MWDRSLAENGPTSDPSTLPQGLETLPESDKAAPPPAGRPAAEPPTSPTSPPAADSDDLCSDDDDLEVRSEVNNFE